MIDLVTIHRIEHDTMVPVEDVLLHECSLDLSINGKLFSHATCSPDSILELGLGLGLSNGCVSWDDSVVRWDFQEHGLSILETAANIESFSSSKPEASSNSAPEASSKSVLSPSLREETFPIPYETLCQLWETFNQKCSLYRETGAAHSMALANDAGIVSFATDASRHSALCKAIGSAALRGCGAQPIAIFSGRMARDMVETAGQCGVTLILSPGAPTHEAVAFAQETSMTLIGFMKGTRANVYCHHENILMG